MEELTAKEYLRPLKLAILFSGISEAIIFLVQIPLDDCFLWFEYGLSRRSIYQLKI